MLTLPRSVKIYLSSLPMDMRRGHDGLFAVVRSWGLDPFSGHLFAFMGKRGDRIKILVFERGGFLLRYKRLGKGRFRVPRVHTRDTVAEEPDGGNLLVRIWRGLGSGNRPELLSDLARDGETDRGEGGQTDRCRGSFASERDSSRGAYDVAARAHRHCAGDSTPVRNDVSYRSISRPLVEVVRASNLPVEIKLLRPPDVRAAARGAARIRCSVVRCRSLMACLVAACPSRKAVRRRFEGLLAERQRWRLSVWKFICSKPGTDGTAAG